MLKVFYTEEFKESLERLKKDKRFFEKYVELLELLINEKPLPKKYHRNTWDEHNNLEQCRITDIEFLIFKIENGELHLLLIHEPLKGALKRFCLFFIILFLFAFLEDFLNLSEEALVISFCVLLCAFCIRKKIKIIVKRAADIIKIRILPFIQKKIIEICLIIIAVSLLKIAFFH